MFYQQGCIYNGRQYRYYNMRSSLHVTGPSAKLSLFSEIQYKYVMSHAGYFNTKYDALNYHCCNGNLKMLRNGIPTAIAISNNSRLKYEWWRLNHWNHRLSKSAESRFRYRYTSKHCLVRYDSCFPLLVYRGWSNQVSTIDRSIIYPLLRIQCLNFFI